MARAGLAVVLAGLLIAAGATTASAAGGPTAPRTQATTAKHKCNRHKHPRKCKHKNRVHKAWPLKKNGRKPHRRLARKLARQVGPIRVRKHKHHHLRAVAGSAAAKGEAPGVAQIGGSGDPNKLLLVRSFDIPTSDPLYADLANYSWTYDNALATIAFVADRDRSQARQLLDQLALLQNRNGSIDFAFDVKTGASAPVVRSGAVAWVGLAGAAFAAKYGDKSYDSMTGATLSYLLGLRNKDGLIPGGPDVSWVSTQHNLLTYELLRELEDLAKHSHKFGDLTRADLTAARVALGKAIDANLLVSDASSAHFNEGAADPRIPIDVQALGAMYLQTRGDDRDEQVGAYIMRPGFYIAPRSTPAASTEVSGLRPFLDAGSPDLIWSEGTIESQFALTRLKTSAPLIAAGVDSLRATNTPSTVGPIGADRDSDTTWGQYRTWPTSAAASWLLMLDLQKSVALFSD